MATKKKTGSKEGKKSSAANKSKVAPKATPTTQANDITSDTDQEVGSEGDVETAIVESAATSTQTDDIIADSDQTDDSADDINPDDNVGKDILSVTGSTLHIVVAAYAGSEALMAKLWAKFAPKDAMIHIVPDAPLSELISEVIANDDIPDEFVFVPANCVPLSPCDEADLKLKKLYITKDGEPIYDSRLPILLNKETCAKMLGTRTDCDNAEEFFAMYADLSLTKPTYVSFHFGNYVLPISRADFNPKALQELMGQKKFATIHIQEAWAASQEFFNKLM